MLFRSRTRIESVIDLELAKLSAFLTRPIIREPLTLISTRKDEIYTLRRDSMKAMATIIKDEKLELNELKAQVAALSPLSTLKRGYAVIQRVGKVILNSRDVKVREQLDVTLAKGNITVEVLNNGAKRRKEK